MPLYRQEKKPEYTYVGLCPRCQGWLMLCVDYPDKQGWRDTAKIVADTIKSGAYVERWHDDKVGEGFKTKTLFRCTCSTLPNEPQANMFAAMEESEENAS